MNAARLNISPVYYSIRCETRQQGNLVVRYSPIGWVLFGATSGSSKTGTVGHIKVKESATAVNISEFWTAESMGVSVKSCSCDKERLTRAEAHEASIIEESCQKIGNQWQISHPWKGTHQHCLITETRRFESSSQPNADLPAFLNKPKPMTTR